MGLYVDKCNLLGYKHEPESFDAGFRYRVRKDFTIIGQLRNTGNFSGVAGILQRQERALSGAQDYQDIYLNGILFGKGKVNRVTFADDEQIGKNQLVYDITCYESGDLSNAISSSSYCAGIDWSHAHSIEGLSENLTYDKDTEGNEEYRHEISIQLTKSGSTTPISVAKAVAANLFGAKTSLTSFLGQFSNLSSVKKYYSEGFNSINGSCQFVENARVAANNSGQYSVSFNYNVQLNEDGYTDITENCDIRGHASYPNSGAWVGYSQLSGGAYTRSNAVYSAYAFSTLPLNTGVIAKSVLVNKFDGIISFSNQFSNNPRYKDIAIWDYSLEVEKNQLGFINVSENGNVIGVGRVYQDKYTNAESFYNNTVATGIDRRLGLFYTGFASSPQKLTTINSSLIKSQSDGQISYSIEKTDNNLYHVTGQIKKSLWEVEIDNPVHLIANFNIFSEKEIIQKQNTSTLGAVSLNIVLKGKRGTSISDYLMHCGLIASNYSEYGTDTFLADLSYNFSPLTNDFRLNALYAFTAPKAFGDLTLT